MLVLETTSPRWQHAIRASRSVVVRLIDEAQAGADLQSWRALSETGGGAYTVTVTFTAAGIGGLCSCRAGLAGQTCKHLAAVLCETGHLRWWSEVVAYRGPVCRPTVVLIDGDDNRETLASHESGIDWGTTAGASGRWWLARKLIEAATHDESLVGPLSGPISERLAALPYEGCRISAALLDRWIAEAKRAARVAA